MKTLIAMLLMTAGANAFAAEFNRENVEIAFDRAKGRIYAVYAKALREHPGLKGTVVYQIDIARTGDITGCRVQSSTMGAPAVEGQICEVIRQIKMPPQPQAVTITKPVGFFPAG